MNEEDIVKKLVMLIKKGGYGSHAEYGYDIYLPSLLRNEFPQNHQQGLFHIEKEIENQLPFYYNAAWELCRRGIIRPGVNAYQAQATLDGSAGNGYSITPFGEQWLAEPGDDFVPTEPGQFSKMLDTYKITFGLGYHQRAQEAVRSYQAHAYLACCAMCGAAAESVLLATAIKKTKEGIDVLKEYRKADGRRKIENILIGKAHKSIQEEFHSYNSLLKYWRDEAAHGRESKIDENEAFIALSSLLRFARFIHDNENSFFSIES